ncbi:MAG: hypothetical protein WC756_17780 [Taibaiella sp.]|jgi:hypothetical protein
MMKSMKHMLPFMAIAMMMEGGIGAPPPHREQSHDHEGVPQGYKIVPKGLSKKQKAKRKNEKNKS